MYFDRAGGAAGALLAALLLCVTPAPAVAFELLRIDNNPCGSARNLFWDPATAGISVDPLASADASIVLNSLSVWNQNLARFRFHSASGGYCNEDDGVIGVGFATKACNGMELGPILGVTVSIFRTDTGELVDGSVTFNANSAVLDDQAVFRQAALHELGHVLGLDHADACGDSGAGKLMKTTINLAAPRLSAPQADDIAGANSIYDPNASPTPGGSVDPTPLPEGANACALGPRAGGEGAAWLVLAPLLLAFRRRAGR